MTPDLNNVFTGMLLKSIHATVKAAGVKNVRKPIGVTRSGKTWFVQITIPGKELTWNGRAYNAAEAKFKAWSKWLEKYAPEGAGS